MEWYASLLDGCQIIAALLRRVIIDVEAATAVSLSWLLYAATTSLTSSSLLSHAFCGRIVAGTS